jgi:hypothetical protein
LRYSPEFSRDFSAASERRRTTSEDTRTPLAFATKLETGALSSVVGMEKLSRRRRLHPVSPSPTALSQTSLKFIPDSCGLAPGRRKLFRGSLSEKFVKPHAGGEFESELKSAMLHNKEEIGFRHIRLYPQVYLTKFPSIWP